MTPFAGRAVVITGAASGIGGALARVLATQGARLLLADVDTVRLETLAETLRIGGATCLTQACDVAQSSALEALAARALIDLGGADVLVNNAGVALLAPAESLNLHDAHWLMEINFWGMVHGCRAFLPQLRSRPGSVIVNLSSVFAMVSPPTQSIYSASKAAVRAFSDSLREELREAKHKDERSHGVRVLCVEPGGIRTRLVEQARLGDISLIADNPQALYLQFERLACTSADQAAASIVRALHSGRTRLLVGTDARLADLLYRLVPGRASAWFYGLARWGWQRLNRARPRQ